MITQGPCVSHRLPPAPRHYCLALSSQLAHSLPLQILEGLTRSVPLGFPEALSSRSVCEEQQLRLHMGVHALSLDLAPLATDAGTRLPWDAC